MIENSSLLSYRANFLFGFEYVKVFIYFVSMQTQHLFKIGEGARPPADGFKYGLLGISLVSLNMFPLRC